MSILFAQPIEQYPFGGPTTTPVMQTPHPSFPASNLLTRDPTQVSRSVAGSASSIYITWDLGAPFDFDVVSLIDCNFTASALFTIQVSADNGSGSPAAWTNVFNGMAWPELSSDPGAGPFTRLNDPRRAVLGKVKTWFYSPTILNYRWLRVRIQDSTNPDGFISVGRMFVGYSWKPKTAMQYGSSFSFGDTGTFDRTDMGAPAAMDGRSIVSAQVKQSFISSQEMFQNVMEYSYWRASTREILACLDLETKSTIQKNLLYARISDGRQVSADDFNCWSQTWNLECF